MQSYGARGSDAYSISQAFKNLAQKVLNDNKEEFNKFFTNSELFCDEVAKNGFTFDTSYQTIANYSVVRAV